MTAAPRTISPDELADRIRAGRAPVLLDVRTPAEHATVHMPDSISLPLDMLRQHRQQVADRLAADDVDDDEVVLVCQSGGRAQQAAGELAAVGRDAALVLDGGIAGLERRHERLTRRAGERWQMERQVRMAAGSLVLTGFLGGKLVSPAVGYLAGAVGAGLTYSALSDSCAMARVLDKMPWNRDAAAPSIEDALDALSEARRPEAAR